MLDFQRIALKKEGVLNTFNSQGKKSFVIGRCPGMEFGKAPKGRKHQQQAAPVEKWHEL